MLLWYKCKGDIWCDLFKVDLDHPSIRNTTGIYIVWYEQGSSRKVLRVGMGNIFTEINKLQKDLTYKAFAAHGVSVTWADAPIMKRAGVATYFINTLSPAILGDAIPRSIPIKENLPWDD